MTEERIAFENGEGLVLEGRLHMAGPGPGVVITHPHPLYGGDMHNMVVGIIRNAYAKKGYATLRFNFRGVGESTGAFDDGEGEQRDVSAACAYLRDRGVLPLVLAGYSFGAWVNAHAAAEIKIDGMILVSPPAALLPFKPAAAFDALKLVVTGGADGFAPPALLKKRIAEWNPSAELVVIDGADHFYSGYADDLETALLKTIPPAASG